MQLQKIEIEKQKLRLIKRICQEMHSERMINLWKLALHFSPYQLISIGALPKLKDLSEKSSVESQMNSDY